MKPNCPMILAAAAAKSLQSCPTLCDPIDGSPPGYPVPGILKARTLEWVAISFSNAWKWKVKGKSLSRVRLFATPWIAAYQAPPSMGFSRQEYWSGVPLPSPWSWQRCPKSATSGDWTSEVISLSDDQDELYVGWRSQIQLQELPVLIDKRLCWYTNWTSLFWHRCRGQGLSC